MEPTDEQPHSTEVAEQDYKPDFEIADKYINFSSELLRLSLLAITGIGTLILFTFKEGSILHLTLFDKYMLFATLLIFALASGAALAHRFWASDSLSYHIAYLRKKTQNEKDGRKACLKRAGNFLILTEYLFGFALFFFVITLFQFLMKY